MKKSNTPQPAVQEVKCPHAVAGHEHLHAANCGHKSYVHAGHICYEHENHFHYMHDGHAHECPGPFVQQKVRPVVTTGKPAKVIKLDPTKARKK
jgi:hypothetical protein